MFCDPGSAGKLMRIRNTGQLYRENGFKYSRGRVSVITHVFNFLHVYLILFLSGPPVFRIRMDVGFYGDQNPDFNPDPSSFCFNLP